MLETAWGAAYLPESGRPCLLQKTGKQNTKRFHGDEFCAQCDHDALPVSLAVT